MKKRLLLVALVLGVVTASVAAFYRVNYADKGPDLITAEASQGDVVETVQATGTLEAVTTVQVGTQVSGTIKTLHADFNSQVRKGQVIAELDPSLLEAQVEQERATLVRLQAEADRARVQLDDANVKLRRARELAARQLIPAADFETADVTARAADSALKSADAQLVQARAQLNQAQVNLDHTIIRAPIDGIVVSRNVDVGQTVAASMQAPTLYVLANDLTQMHVNASIDESDIGQIRQGQRATFRVDAFPNETFTGTVSQVRLQPVVNQNVVSYNTLIDVQNSQMMLKPGMTATVTVEVARANNVVRVPNAALRFRPTPDVFAALGQQMPDQPASTNAERRSAAAGSGMGGAVNASNDQRGQTTARDDGSRFADMTPGQRDQMRQRVMQMSPEERERMRQRFQQRRESTGQGVGAAGGSTRGVPAQLWVLREGHITPVRVRAGISDGANTAIVAGDVQPGATVLTGVTTPHNTAPTSGSPLLPFGGRFGRGGGAGGNRSSSGGGGSAGRQ
jgi:HlyD family secretion protein